MAAGNRRCCHVTGHFKTGHSLGWFETAINGAGKRCRAHLPDFLLHGLRLSRWHTVVCRYSRLPRQPAEP